MITTIDRVRNAIEKSLCVPVIGAGLSFDLGAPSWKAYLRSLTEGLPESVRQSIDVSRAKDLDIASFLIKLRQRDHLPPVPIITDGFTAAHILLAGLRCPLYVTTNYDTAIEDAIRERWCPPTVLSNDTLDGPVLSLAPPPCTVIKLCSGSHRSNPGALSREDFATLLHSDTAAKELLKLLFRTRMLLFLGCSMQDPLIEACLKECYSVRIGAFRHVAFLPNTAAGPTAETLADFGVDTILLSPEDYSSNLEKELSQFSYYLKSCEEMLIVESTLPSRAKPILDALLRLKDTEDIPKATFVTDSEVRERELEAIFHDFRNRLDVSIERVDDLHNSKVVVSQLMKKSSRASYVLAPTEYSVLPAAQLCEAWKGPDRPRYHPLEAAKLSRNKGAFREFLLGTFEKDSLIGVPWFHHLDTSEFSSPRELLDKLKAVVPTEIAEIVVKPIDAAGSIGVRPLSLSDVRKSETAADDFLRILGTMPFEAKTARCSTTNILVEERIRGEEFSVEIRKAAGTVEVLTIHWKVDIDSDATRFFERTFVTLPSSCDQYRSLETAVNRIFEKIPFSDGVFHAEFRLRDSDGRVYPLEIALRPGGGMVSYSVLYSSGVNLIETAVRCALNRPQLPRKHERAVGTGLVFALEPGVLPVLMVADSELGHLSVRKGDTEGLRAWFKRLLSTISRAEVKEYLATLLNRNSPIPKDVLSQFEALSLDEKSVGMDVSVDEVHFLMNPGDLVTEEEASYVAGILVTAQPRSGAHYFAAVAEAVGATAICLKSIVCKPAQALTPLRLLSARKLETPTWWTEVVNRGFRSDPDSMTFSMATAKAMDSLSLQRPVRLWDLGCGCARPMIELVRQGHIYVGIDIDEKELADARGNLAKFGCETQKLARYDVKSSGWWRELLGVSEGPDIIAANLPYLPCPDEDFPAKDIHVDGGPDGLRFVPAIPLQIADNCVRESA
jgi:hypothetical protein